MKYIVLGFALFIVVTFWMRKRGERRAPRSARKAAMFDSGGDSVDVRSADNVRLISDDQLNAIDGKREKPVERKAPERN
jgi:hypothetical protein